MVVDLADGRTLSVPLAWFPRLMAATPEQCERVRISRKGLYWEELDEGVSVASLLAGRGDQTGQPKQAACADALTNVYIPRGYNPKGTAGRPQTLPDREPERQEQRHDGTRR